MSTTVQGFYDFGHGHTGQKLFNVAMDLAEMGFDNQKVETLRMVDPGDRSADQRDPKSVTHKPAGNSTLNGNERSSRRLSL